MPTRREPRPGRHRAHASSPAREPRTRGTGNSDVHRRCCSRSPTFPTARHVAGHTRFAAPRTRGRSDRATYFRRSASPATASDTRTSSRSTTAGPVRVPRPSGGAPAQTSFPAAAPLGRWRRNCTIALPMPTDRNSCCRNGDRRRCTRSPVAGAPCRTGSHSPSWQMPWPAAQAARWRLFLRRRARRPVREAATACRASQVRGASGSRRPHPVWEPFRPPVAARARARETSNHRADPHNASRARRPRIGPRLASPQGRRA